MSSGESIQGFIPGGLGPGVEGSNPNGTFALYSVDEDVCTSAQSLPDNPWNPLSTWWVAGKDINNDDLDWCGLQLPCSYGNYVMGADGICGVGQAYHSVGDFYANLYDHGHNNAVVGRYVYTDPNIKTNCVALGSVYYEEIIRCYFDSPMC